MNHATPAADENSQNRQQVSQPKLELQAVYSKNSSFELGKIGKTADKWQPEMRVEIDSHGERLEHDLIEVTLSIRITALQQQQTAYVIQHEQAGRFLLQRFKDSQIERLLKGYCAQTLYPYAREAISSMVIRSGFPHIYLDPINFDATYLAQNQQKDKTEMANTNDDNQTEAEIPLT